MAMRHVGVLARPFAVAFVIAVGVGAGLGCLTPVGVLTGVVHGALGGFFGFIGGFLLGRYRCIAFCVTGLCVSVVYDDYGLVSAFVALCPILSATIMGDRAFHNLA